MKQPQTVKSLEDLGRVRLSRNFYMRDFLHSEIANLYGMSNIPDDPELAVEVGRKLCIELLEPIHERFGRLAIRSAYRSCSVNRFGNENGHNCARNEANYGAHIWDRVDANGRKGAMACVVAPRFADYFEKTGDWQAMAWWIHDQLPYSTLYFYRCTERHVDEARHGQPRRIARAQVRGVAHVRSTVAIDRTNAVSRRRACVASALTSHTEVTLNRAACPFNSESID
jgi:hypothetical protein